MGEYEIQYYSLLTVIFKPVQQADGKADDESEIVSWATFIKCSHQRGCKSNDI